MRKTYLFPSIVFVAALVLSVLPLNDGNVRAQTKPTNGHYQYAVKFICGKASPLNNVWPNVVAQGTYFTAINVHNPFASAVKFRKKFAVALPKQKAGQISGFEGVSLIPDGAFEIDCAEILSRTPMHNSFRKGFVVIESQTELDVVVVYTAAGSSGAVETMELERVPARRVP